MRMTTKERARVLRVGAMNEAEYEQELDRLETVAVELEDERERGARNAPARSRAYLACIELMRGRSVWEDMRRDGELRPTLTLVAGGVDAG